jgi:predicted RNA-binding protein with PUA-like domain
MPWLIKTEPDCYSIDDFAREKRTRWTGVRNFQARNFMRDGMKVGDPILFYHSSCEPPGVAGLARVSAAADWDCTALDPKDQHFDAKATKENPIWMAVEVAFVRKFAGLVDLATLRSTKGLEKMALLQRGQRLSVLPVTEAEYAAVLALAEGKPRR